MHVACAPLPGPRGNWAMAVPRLGDSVGLAQTVQTRRGHRVLDSPSRNGGPSLLLGTPCAYSFPPPVPGNRCCTLPVKRCDAAVPAKSPLH